MPMFITDTKIDLPYYDFEGFMRPTFRTSRHNIFNLTNPRESLALKATLSKKSGGYAGGKPAVSKKFKINLATPPEEFVHPVVFESDGDPDYRAILAHIEAAKDRLNTIKRFDMPGFQPRYEYLREMKRYGVLPKELAANTEIDIYATDRAYWQSLWYKASAVP